MAATTIYSTIRWISFSLFLLASTDSAFSLSSSVLHLGARPLVHVRSPVSSNVWTTNTNVAKVVSLSQTIKTTTTTPTTTAMRACLVDEAIDEADNWVFRRAIQIANHIPALASIAYFGLISMAGMMDMSPTSSNPAAATLASVLTNRVGPTSNMMFSNYFPTLVTPPSWVFLIWPLISVAQLATVVTSAITPLSFRKYFRSNNVDDNENTNAPSSSTKIVASTSTTALLNQDDLTTLSAANIAATLWLLVSSQATKLSLPLGSALILPFVPLLSGYPLRQRQQPVATKDDIQQDDRKRVGQKRLFVFELYSSFTTLAALLAFVTELQHGGRVPFFLNKPELCASIFLGGAAFLVNLPRRTRVKKIVNAGVLSGIWIKRFMATVTGGGWWQLLTSVSSWGTTWLTGVAIGKIFDDDGNDLDN